MTSAQQIYQQQLVDPTMAALLGEFKPGQIAAYLKSKEYLVIDGGQTDEEILNDVACQLHEYNIHVNLLDNYEVEQLKGGDIKVDKNSGSIVDRDAEEVLEQLSAKHGYRLADVLRTLL